MYGYTWLLYIGYANNCCILKFVMIYSRKEVYLQNNTKTLDMKCECDIIRWLKWDYFALLINKIVDTRWNLRYHQIN